MTPEQFKELRAGDSISHITHPIVGYVVTGNYGNRVTAVRVIDATNPVEWELISWYPRQPGYQEIMPDQQRSPIGQAWLSLANKIADAARKKDTIRMSLLRDLIIAFEKEFPEETAAENKFWAGKEK